MKNVFTICLVCAAFLFLTGCEFGGVNSYIKQHPEVSSDIADCMKNHTIKVGMDKEQVELAAGSGYSRREWVPALGINYIGDYTSDSNNPDQIWVYTEYEYETVKKPFSSSGYSYGGYQQTVGVKWEKEATGNYTEKYIYFENNKVVTLAERYVEASKYLFQGYPGLNLKNY